VFGLENLDGWKLVVLGLLAVLLIGPERLPRIIADGVRTLRHLRSLARNATADLSRELGTEVTLADLHPKALVRKHLLSEEDEQAMRAPVQELYRGLRQDLSGVRDGVLEARDDLSAATRRPAAGSQAAPSPAPRGIDGGSTRRPGGNGYDPDAT
jgi:sec-independent protein translocase protein TatB